MPAQPSYFYMLIMLKLLQDNGSVIHSYLFAVALGHFEDCKWQLSRAPGVLLFSPTQGYWRHVGQLLRVVALLTCPRVLGIVY